MKLDPIMHALHTRKGNVLVGTRPEAVFPPTANSHDGVVGLLCGHLPRRAERAHLAVDRAVFCD